MSRRRSAGITDRRSPSRPRGKHDDCCEDAALYGLNPSFKSAEVILQRRQEQGISVRAVEVAGTAEHRHYQYVNRHLEVDVVQRRTIDHRTSALLVGAGVGGKAITVALAVAGLGLLTIANCRRQKSEELAGMIVRAAPSCVVEVTVVSGPTGFDIVIDATSLGLNGTVSLPFDVADLSPTALVGEVVMVPELTSLLAATKLRKIQFLHGRELMIHQIEAGADFLGMHA